MPRLDCDKCHYWTVTNFWLGPYLWTGGAGLLFQRHLCDCVAAGEKLLLV